MLITLGYMESEKLYPSNDHGAKVLSFAFSVFVADQHDNRHSRSHSEIRQWKGHFLKSNVHKISTLDALREVDVRLRIDSVEHLRCVEDVQQLRVAVVALHHHFSHLNNQLLCLRKAA